MKFYSFGKESDPVILLLPGTSCHWKKNFGHVIPLLEQDFHVTCISYDGFDETEDSVFSNMLSETEKIEAYVLERFQGHVLAAYGCSMGGSFVGLLMQRKKIHIDHGILGSSDLDQAGGLTARFQAWLVGKMIYGMLQKGKLPGFMQKKLDKMDAGQRKYMEQMLEMFGIGTKDMAFVKRESVRNQFYSDLVTPLEDNISVPGSMVHIFYAEKMGEKYEARYRKHFENPDIRRHAMQHEELLMRYPERWAEEICLCCGRIKPQKAAADVK